MEKNKIISSKRVKVFLAITILLFLFRGEIFKKLFVYEVIGIRDIIELNDENIINLIEDEVSDYPEGIDDLEIVQKICNNITSSILSISISKAQSNPNKLFKSEKANCLGYSAMYTSIFHYITENYGVVRMYFPEHCVGKIKLLGYDIHKYINDPFWQDHDFVVISNGYSTITTKGIDPMLYDFIGIDEVSHQFTF